MSENFWTLPILILWSLKPLKSKTTGTIESYLLVTIVIIPDVLVMNLITKLY